VIHDFGGWSPDGSRIAYTANDRDEAHFDVYVQDIASGVCQGVYQGRNQVSVSGFRADGKTLALTMTNTGSVSCIFTIGLDVAYLASGGSTKTVTVAAGGTATATLQATTAGRYDYTVTANTGDNFGRRFAGRLYAQ